MSQAANPLKTVTKSFKKGFDPQRIKSDITKALADPAFSKDLVALADEILDKKKQKSKLSCNSGRNLVRLNARAMGFWKEYEKQKNSHLSQVREHMLQKVTERNELQIT